MKSKLLSGMKKTGVVIAALMFASAANATLISLNFDSGFVKTDIDADAIVTASDVMTSVGGVNVHKEIFWLPTSSPASTLVVQNFNQVVDTVALNTPVVLQTFTQTNNVIFSNNPVGWSLGFVSELTIDGSVGPLVNNNITFNETPNVAGCPFGNPSGTTCDDIYTVTDIEEYIDIGGGLSLHVFLLPGAGVTCLDAGAGMLDCYTPEQSPGVTTISVYAEIVSQIPEPGMVTLLGLGLVGFGLARRKKA